MEGRLRRCMLVGVTDRAGAPRPAAALEAVAALAAAKMPGAGIDVIALGAEGAHRAGGQAGFRPAPIAWVARAGLRRNRPARGKGEGAAIAVPEAPARMIQHAERRAVDRLRLHGPALEGQPGLAFEGIERLGAELGREPVDHAPR